MADDDRAALERAYEHALHFHDRRRQRPPQARAGFEDLWAALDGPTPEVGTAAPAVIDELARAAEPGLMGMTGPGFFGWVIGASHPVGVAADWLTSLWGQNGGLYQASPANAVAEQVAARWLLELLHLPPESRVGFTTGATMATFACLAAARGEVLRQVGWEVETEGLFGAPPVSVYVGDEAHPSVFAALQYLGLGRNRVSRLATDGAGRLRVEALQTALAAHTGPALVIAQAGQVNTGAFDPLAAVIDLAHEVGAWVHVDGAFGLWARACPVRAALAAGAEHADSWATDGHKWLQTPYDCGYAIVRNAAALQRAMTIGASYLPTAPAGALDPADAVPELSRRARGFATWAIIRTLGRQGIAALIEQHCRLAHRLAERLAAEPGVAVLNDVDLNQVIVQFGTTEPPERRDELTRTVITRTQADGVCFLGGAQWKGRWVMRLSVIAWPMTTSDIDRAAASILAAWRHVQAGSG